MLNYINCDCFTVLESGNQTLDTLLSVNKHERSIFEGLWVVIVNLTFTLPLWKLEIYLLFTPIYKEENKTYCESHRSMDCDKY